MTLEQAIEFCLHMKEEQYKSAHNTIIGDYPEYEAAPHFRLASEYKQIAKWLTELKEAKRLLKVAVDDIARTESCFLCKYYGKPDESCQTTDDCFVWRYADKAEKLLKEEDANG